MHVLPRKSANFGQLDSSRLTIRTAHLGPWLFALIEMIVKFHLRLLTFGRVVYIRATVILKNRSFFTWFDLIPSKAQPEVPPEVIFFEISKPLTNKRWQRNYSLLQNINSRIIMTWIITIIIILLIFKNHLHFNLNDPPINIKIHMFKMSNFKIQINKLIYFYRTFNERRYNFKRPTSTVFHENDFWHFTNSRKGAD